MGIRTSIICLAIAIGGSQLALAQSPMFDGVYKGSVKCQEPESDIGIITAPLAITIRNGRLVASIPAVSSADIATGVVNADGTLHFAFYVHIDNITVYSEYTGLLDGTNGTLTGTQVWTTELSPASSRRTCKGAFAKVIMPR
jgi:hypothetical protein